MQKHIVLAGVCLAAVLVPPLALGQGEEEETLPVSTFRCKGTLINETPAGGVEVGYTVNCSETVTSYSIVASQEIDSFNPYSGLFNRSDNQSASEGKAFECQGSIPGWGFGCVGGTQYPGAYATGDFTTTEPACNPTDRSKSLRAWVVAKHTEGEGSKAKEVTSEPFALKRTFKCARPAKKTRSQR